MYRYLSIALVIVFIVNCTRAQEEGEGGDCEDGKKGGHGKFLKFYQKVSEEVCKPDKTNDDILKQMKDCKNEADMPEEKKAKFEAMMKKMDEECDPEQKLDLSAYTLVDLTNISYRRMLLGYCNPDFKTCLHNKWMENKKEHKKEEGEHKKDDSAWEKRKEKMEAYQTCIKGVLKIENIE